jgi:succinate-acetate transporter protein
MSDSIHSSDYKEQTSNSEPAVLKIQTTGDGNEFVVIGKQKFYRHELMEAFGGTLNPGLSAPPVHKFANPAALGLSAFSLTTFVLSCYNAGAHGVHTPNVVVGLAAFYGGAVQFLAGVWELVVGNTFGGTALTSYGAFWLSFAAINVESFGIVAAYGEDVEQLDNAVAFYLIGWGMFTFMLTTLTLKSTAAFFSLFFFLGVTYVLLAAGDFAGNANLTKAGGVFGIITAFLGFYNAWAGVATKTNSYITSYAIPLSKQG